MVYTYLPDICLCINFIFVAIISWVEKADTVGHGQGHFQKAFLPVIFHT